MTDLRLYVHNVAHLINFTVKTVYFRQKNAHFPNDIFGFK